MLALTVQSEAMLNTLANHHHVHSDHFLGHIYLVYHPSVSVSVAVNVAVIVAVSASVALPLLLPLHLPLSLHLCLFRLGFRLCLFLFALVSSCVHLQSSFTPCAGACSLTFTLARVRAHNTDLQTRYETRGLAPYSERQFAREGIHRTPFYPILMVANLLSLFHVMIPVYSSLPSDRERERARARARVRLSLTHTIVRMR